MAAPGVLGNDSDPDSDPLTVTGNTSPANGTVALNANGTLTYTPNTNWSGTDTFTYTISDGKGGTDTATVTITVTPVNDPPAANPDPRSTPEDTPITIPVADNDTDPDGSVVPTSVTIVDPPAHGTVTVLPDGSIRYEPKQDYVGPDPFTYRICDDATPAACSVGSVPITVTPVNDPPVAEDDGASTQQNTPVFVDVVLNDSDIDGTLVPASVKVTTPPANGTTAIDATTGKITYTPNNLFAGTDTFVYEVCDDEELCDTATVTVVVAVDPTSIALISLGTTYSNGSIIVRWETGAELDTYGFHLLRSADGSFANATRVTPEQIRGQGRGGGGGSYAFRDTALVPGASYTYWLQEVELDADENLYGPTESVRVPLALTPNVPLPHRLFLPLTMQ